MNTPARSLCGRALALTLVALAAVLPSAALAAGEQYGRISGYVYDPTGAALAEVPVKVSGPALQQPMMATTGDDGRYSFITLPPGEGYTVEVAIEGFNTQKRTGISVRVGQAVPVDITLAELTETQATATFEAEVKVNPILDAETARTGAVITAEKAEATPIFNQVQAVAQLAPGVGPGNAPSLRGGLSRYGKFYIDGMDTTDPVDGSISAPMNYYAVENFEIQTGGLDAQYNALGVVENVVTKSGSNRFTYDVGAILSPKWSNAKSQAASNQSGIARQFTQTEVKQAETAFYSPVAAFGGPIIKDKLWFFISGSYNFSDRDNPLGTESRPTSTRTGNARLKLTYQPSPKDRVSVAVNWDRNQITNQFNNTTTDILAESQIDRGGLFLITNYDRTISENVLFQLQAGATTKGITRGPMNLDPDAVGHRSNGVFYFTADRLSGESAANQTFERRNRFQFDPTLLFKLGNHQMKTGVQLSYLYGHKFMSVTGDERYLDNAGGFCNPDDPATYANCSSRIRYYNTDGVFGAAQRIDAANSVAGVFLQDRWTLNRHLTFTAGVRADGSKLYSDGEFITNLFGVSPRLSAVYDIGGDRKTLLKAGYGRSVEVSNLTIAQESNPDLIAVTSRWQAASESFADCEPFSNATGCTTTGGPDSRSFKGGHVPPRVDEVQLGIHRGIGDSAAFGVDGTYRKYSRMWMQEEVNRIWDPSGQRVVDYVNGTAQTVYTVQADRRAWRDYKGVDLWTSGRIGKWDLLASYTLAYNRGTMNDYLDLFGANPRFDQFAEGWASDDIRHTFKGVINYFTGQGLDLGMQFRYRSGTPLWQYQFQTENGQRVYRTERGTGYAVNATTGAIDYNDPGQVVSLRNPDQFILDANVRYDLGKTFNLGRNKIDLQLLLFNILNNTDPTSYVEEYSTSNRRYGTVAGRRSPFQGELVLRFRN